MDEAKPNVDELTDEQREYWEERAAIREYDGEMTRQEAEREALKDVWKYFEGLAT